jgi:hypothetical protein
MANPNIVNVQTIRGMSTVRRYVKTFSVPLISNAPSSQQIIKVNSLYITQNSANQQATVNVTLTLSTTSGNVQIINNVSIPVTATFTPIDTSRVIYVGEGETLSIRASSNDKIGVVCSYEQISDSFPSDRNDDIVEELSPELEGDALYTTPGTYTWLAPFGPSSICVVCVGGGGAGDDGNSGDGGGGGGAGGGLVYANNIPVTQGTSYTVVVGAGGNNGNGKNTRATNGANSSFTAGSFVMTAIGGEGGAPYSTSPGATGRSYTVVNVPVGVTFGGGTGGGGGAGYNGGGGGGGAAGYDGVGGNGSASISGYGVYTSGFNGVGLGSGGGGGTYTTRGLGASGGANGGTGQSDVTGGGGGGATIFSGYNPPTNGGNGNGSTSSGSKGGDGGWPGGGGGGSWDNNTGVVSLGGNGAVKIIWGVGRSFPLNAQDLISPPAPTTITDGLVLYLDAANPDSYPGTGTTWFDLLGISNGTLTNGPVYTQSNQGYFTFDGSNDGVSLSGSNLSVNQMTISSWNFSSNYAHNGFMFEKTTNGSVNTQYSLFYNNDNTIYYRTYGLTTTDQTINTTTAGVVNNQWNNVVATYNGSQKKIYVNGVLVSTQSVTGTVTQNTTGAAYVGIYGSFAGYPFNGRISQTLVYNRALSDAEVLNNYNAVKDRYNPTPLNIVTSGLTVYLDAANSSSYTIGSSTWNDLSGNGNNMTLFNSPTFSSRNRGVIQFNGSNQYGTIAGLNYSTTSFTIIAGTRYSGSTRGRVITAVNNNWLFGHWQSSAESYYAEGWIVNNSVNDTNWRIYTATENYPSNQRSFYSNNVALATNSSSGSQGFNGLSLGRSGIYNEYSTCEASFILIYNRILTTQEITQNYNAFRSRFDL